MKAGKYANSAALASGTLIAEFSDQAEGFINAMTRFDWVTNYASVPANYKPALADASSSLASIYLMTYDPSGYTSRGEYEDMVNILYDRATKLIEVLKDRKLQETMGVSP
jgi:hypothetical protein